MIGFKRILEDAQYYSKILGVNKYYLLCGRIVTKVLYGFTKEQYYIYFGWAYNRHGRARLFSNNRSKEIQSKCNKSASIHFFENKVDFLNKFSSFVKREWIYLPNVTKKEAVEFCDKNNIVMAKPLDLMQGQGIKMINSDDDITLLFEDMKSKKYILEERVLNHKDLNFNNLSLNTIRVFTLLDKNGECKIIQSILRVGIGNSVVDNFCAGGVAYPVDSETGVVEGKGIDGKGERYLIHPGSDIVMPGYRIPCWTEVIDLVKQASKIVSDVRWVGWDVAITQKGVELIEGNHDPDVDFIEMSMPLNYKIIMRNV